MGCLPCEAREHSEAECADPPLESTRSQNVDPPLDDPSPDRVIQMLSVPAIGLNLPLIRTVINWLLPEYDGEAQCAPPGIASPIAAPVLSNVLYCW